jgi:2-(3-amino-3-carboxypropyl)histidine synthase
MDIIKELKKKKAKRIFIQYPEGLKLRIQNIAKDLEDNGFEAVICCEPCYGACDIRDYEAERLGCNAILHIGHSNLKIKSKIPVIYWEYFYTVDPIPILKEEIDELKGFRKIGIVTSVQFNKTTDKVIDFLKETGKEVYIHKSLKYPGQILGCNIDAAKKIEDKVDCFLYVGAGKFHPLGVAMNTEKPVFTLDIEKKRIYNLEKERIKWLKRKSWHDSDLNDAKKVGIIVCWKKGQGRMNEARKLKKELENKGKEVSILAFDDFKKEKIEGLKFDVLLNLACPRLDDELIYS